MKAIQKKKGFVFNKGDTFLHSGKVCLLVEEYDTENIYDDIQVTRLNDWLSSLHFRRDGTTVVMIYVTAKNDILERIFHISSATSVVLFTQVTQLLFTARFFKLLP